MRARGSPKAGKGLVPVRALIRAPVRVTSAGCTPSCSRAWRCKKARSATNIKRSGASNRVCPHL